MFVLISVLNPNDSPEKLVIYFHFVFFAIFLGKIRDFQWKLCLRFINSLLTLMPHVRHIMTHSTNKMPEQGHVTAWRDFWKFRLVGNVYCNEHLKNSFMTLFWVTVKCVFKARANSLSHKSYPRIFRTRTGLWRQWGVFQAFPLTTPKAVLLCQGLGNWRSFESTQYSFMSAHNSKIVCWT